MLPCWQSAYNYYCFLILCYWFFTDKCPATSILASQIGPSPVVNHLLLGRRPRSAQRSSKNCIIHNGGVPQAHSTPSQDQMMRPRHHSPWRTHVRAHRRNIARARAQLGFDDSLEIEDQTDASKTEKASEEGEERRLEEDKDDEEQGKLENEEQEKLTAGSSDVSQQDHSTGEGEELQQIDNQLSSLELEPESSPEPASASDPPTPTPEPQPEPTAPAPLPSTRRPGSDSSSSESVGSLRRSPSTLAGEPPKPQQIFSPFPCIKTPRKSVAARNLGLYGPTARTPNVHFPQMSRSMNCVGSTTKRRWWVVD